MKTVRLTFVLLFLTISFSFGQQNEHYFKFSIKNKEKLEKLTRIISIDNYKNGTVFAYANNEQLKKFKAETDYQITMLTHPSKDKSKVIEMATTVSEMSNWDKYPTYDVYVQMMNDFANNYPNICSLENIGTTVDGRDLLVAKISDNVSQEEDEPEFFYTSTMHGDETTGFVFMLRFMDSLLTNYGSDPEITEFVDNIAIYVNPNANPDGTYSSGNSTVSGATRFNANGIDINRNFPDPEDGEHPDGNSWQPETQAMMDFADQHTFVLSANFHGGAEVANYPWDTWSRSHADETWLQYISHVYADPAMANSPSGYFTGISANGVTNGYDWYTITGGRQDYMTYFHHCREVTMEVSSVKLLSSDELREYWNYNAHSLFDYMEQSLYGIRGIVTDESGNPLDAMITIEGHDSDLDSSMVFTDPDVGDYHRMIEAGTYNVIFSSYGYFSDTVENVTVNQDDSIRIDVSLTAKNTYNISGIITDEETGNPIENAEVSVINTPLSPVYTNSSGEYTLNSAMEGNQTLQIRKSGYATKTVDIFIDASNTTFNFVLYDADIEDFESGDFSSFAWNMSGSADWTITSSEQQEGVYSAKSGDITDDQESSLTIEIMVQEAGELSFYKKVSSESSYDFLEFYIDGTKQDSWSGSVNWSEESYPLTTGSHTLMWKYVKDYSQSDGSDCGWIDYITFPKLVPPGLNFSPDTLETFMEVGSARTETLQLTNSGNGSVDYTLDVEDAASNPWISLSTNSGTVQSMQTTNVDVELTTGQEDSVYSCNLLLSHNGTKVDTTIPVIVHADYYPELSTNPTSFNETIYKDSTFHTILEISNSGTGVLDYSASIENPGMNTWIQLTNSSDTIASGTDSIEVNINATGLSTGNYSASIIINDNTKGQTTIPVNIEITEIDHFNLSVNSLDFNIEQFTQTEGEFYISNLLSQSVNYSLSLSDSGYAEVFNIQNSNGTLEISDSDTISFNVKATGLTAGNYSFNLQVSGNTRYQEEIPVTLNIQEAEVLTAEPGSFDISLDVEEKDTTTFTLKNNTFTGVNFGLVSGSLDTVNWMTLNLPDDSIPPKDSVEITVYLDPSSLDEGNYEAAIKIQQTFNSDITNVPFTLEVTKDPVNGIQNQAGAILSAKCYPNPVKERLYIDLNIDKMVEKLNLSVFSLTGSRLWSRNLNNIAVGKHRLSIHAGSISKGHKSLIIRITTNNNQAIEKKIIITK